MKKLLYLFLTVLMVGCSDDDGNPCLYNPTLTTSAVTNITETAATLNGVISIVSQNCDDPNNTEQGFVYATTIQPTIANTKVNVNGTDVTTTLENLEPNTTYYVRTFLTNALGEFYGNEVSFITVVNQSCEYNLITQEATDITSSSATLNGTISIDEENCEFPIIEQGFVYSIEVQPTIADTQVNVNGTEVITTVDNLEPNTTYYTRTFLTNNDGEFYGNEVSFITSEEPCEVVYLAENGITIKACEDANVGDTGVINGITYTVVDEAMLRDMVDNGDDVTNVAITKVTNMFELFFIDFDTPSDFNQNISSWDVSNVTTMEYMFTNTTAFIQDLSSWDVSSVTTMKAMFRLSNYNQPIGNWDVSNVTNMELMFYSTEAFNQLLNGWDVSNVTDMRGMFCLSNYNQPIGNWDVSNVTNMDSMFSGADAFNQPIGDWDVSNVTNMLKMFGFNSFNQPIGDWDVGNVNDMSFMFTNATSFNQPIDNWDVSNVTDMEFMFFEADAFNQPIGDWDVSNVTTMKAMFFEADAFNQSIGDWSVSNVTDMNSMFSSAILFNKDLSSWSVDGVTNCTEFSNGATSWTLPQPNFTNCTP